jgi:hypothetical protein
MKKNFLTAGAVIVAALMLATTLAQAADVTMGGEFWTRYEVFERNDWDDQTNADSYIQGRVRLNANVKVNDTTSAFIQLQSNRSSWGETNEGVNGAQTTPGGLAGNQSVNDMQRDVGMHQAYFTLKNFAGLPFDAKVGRQEIILDAHRIFGNTLWTMGAHSHDAIRLDHKHDNMALTYLYIQESEEVFTQDAQDSEDQTTQAIYANFAGILGGKLSTMYIYQADGCGGDYAELNNGACSGGANDTHTIGFRQAGQLFGLDYRGEYYYQFGDAQGWAARSTRANADNGGYANDGSDVDREAYMFGIRVGKQFKNVSMKPKLTLWYDYLSGTSDEDRGNNKMKSFQTVYDTGHKFYGLQDLFLGLGTGDCGGGTCGLGLQDVAIKAQINPVPGWTVKTAFHHFSTAEGIAGSPVSANVSAAASTTDSSVLGQELDITVVNKYNANTKIMMGYSHFSQAAGLRSLRTTYGTDDANWFYTQVHVNF